MKYIEILFVIFIIGFLTYLGYTKGYHDGWNKSVTENDELYKQLDRNYNEMAQSAVQSCCKKYLETK